MALFTFETVLHINVGSMNYITFVRFFSGNAVRDTESELCTIHNQYESTTKNLYNTRGIGLQDRLS